MRENFARPSSGSEPNRHEAAAELQPSLVRGVHYLRRTFSPCARLRHAGPASGDHMRKQLLFASVVVCLVGASICPAPAHACQCLATAIYRSNPVDGTDNVPLNKALLVEGVFVEDSVTLENAAGEAVAFTLNAGPTPSCAGTWAELVPKQPLAPHAKYTIRVRPIYPDPGYDAGPPSLSFTTGADMLETQVLETPKGNASVVLGGPNWGGCASTNAMACVSVEPRQNIEMLALAGERVLLRWLLPEEAELTFGFEVAPDCVELRRRDSTGNRSAPLKICGKALGTRAYRDSDTKDFGIICRDGVIGATGESTDVSDKAPVEVSDGGVDLDDVPADPPNPSPQGAAGASSNPPGPNPAQSSSQPQKRTYGCAAVPGEREWSGSWFALSIAIVVAARSSRRRRNRE